MESSSPNLDAEFACIGDLYVDDMNCSGSSDDEQPASAAAACVIFRRSAGEAMSRSDGLWGGRAAGIRRNSSSPSASRAALAIAK